MFSCSISAITPSKKGWIITNRKSTDSFLMSLRWTAYVAPMPSERDSKMQTDCFRIKVDLSRKRSMLLVFWHQQCLLQSIVFHLTFWPKLTHPAAQSLCDSWATCSVQFCTNFCMDTVLYLPWFFKVVLVPVVQHLSLIYVVNTKKQCTSACYFDVINRSVYFWCHINYDSIP